VRVRSEEDGHGSKVWPGIKSTGRSRTFIAAQGTAVLSN
jgi:hypothetical protein